MVHNNDLIRCTSQNSKINKKIKSISLHVFVHKVLKVSIQALFFNFIEL